MDRPSAVSQMVNASQHKIVAVTTGVKQHLNALLKLNVVN
jgi:hypothetical protein